RRSYSRTDASPGEEDSFIRTAWISSPGAPLPAARGAIAWPLLLSQSSKVASDQPQRCAPGSSSLTMSKDRDTVAEARGSRAAREVSFDGAEVGFRVDSDRGLVGLDDRDRDPVLEESQLLELLGELERRGWQEVEGLERGAPVGVEADVPEASDASSVAVVRDRVLREVERPAVGGADHLVHVRVVRLVGQEPDLERRHLGARALPERRDEERDVARCDQRLVALDGHVHVGGARLRDLPAAVRSRRMLRRR